MNQKLQTFLFFFFLLILLPALFCQAEVSISVSPIRVEQIGKPGDRGTDMVSVTNGGSDPTRLKVSVMDWTLTKEGTPTFQKPGGAPYSCASWIKVNPIDFRISPGQTREVRYTVTIPEGTPEGGYRAAIVFETVPDVVPGEKIRRVFIRGRIATILYTVVGKPAAQGHANSLKVEIKKDGADFTLTLQNTGKVHYRTKGIITANDSNGQKVFDVQIPDDPVLPQSERHVKIHYDKPIPKGKYTAMAVVDIGVPELIGAEATFTVE